MDPEHITLTDEQEELLCEMVEAHRNLPEGQRDKFMLSTAMTRPPHLIHNGFPDGQLLAYEADVTELHNKAMLNVKYGGKGTPNYMLSAEAFEYYEHLKSKEEEPVSAMEDDIRRFLEAGRLASSYPDAHGKWASAAEYLRSPDAEEHLTKIGHDCRERCVRFPV